MFSENSVDVLNIYYHSPFRKGENGEVVVKFSLTRAEIPFSGRNVNFEEQVLAAKPHLILFSKPDLADLNEREFINRYYKDRGISKILYANCAKDIDVTLKKKVAQLTRTDFKLGSQS